MIPLLLLAVLVDEVDAQRQRARLMEIQGRLGLRPQRLRGTEARMDWVVRQYDHARAGIVAALIGPHLDEGETVSLVDPLIPWLAAQLENRHLERQAVDGGLFEPFPDIVDWYRHQVNEGEAVDLGQIDWVQARDRAAVWHRELGKRFAVAGTARRGRLVHSWPDGSTMQSLETRKAVEEEGEVLAHCVGSYWPKILAGSIAIFSYRDAGGSSLATIEITRTGTATQVRGFQNKLITDPLINERISEVETKLQRIAAELYKEDVGEATIAKWPDGWSLQKVNPLLYEKVMGPSPGRYDYRNPTYSKNLYFLTNPDGVVKGFLTLNPYGGVAGHPYRSRRSPHAYVGSSDVAVGEGARFHSSRHHFAEVMPSLERAYRLVAGGFEFPRPAEQGLELERSTGRVYKLLPPEAVEEETRWLEMGNRTAEQKTVPNLFMVAIRDPHGVPIAMLGFDAETLQRNSFSSLPSDDWQFRRRLKSYYKKEVDQGEALLLKTLREDPALVLRVLGADPDLKLRLPSEAYLWRQIQKVQKRARVRKLSQPDVVVFLDAVRRARVFARKHGAPESFMRVVLTAATDPITTAHRRGATTIELKNGKVYVHRRSGLGTHISDKKHLLIGMMNPEWYDFKLPIIWGTRKYGLYVLYETLI